MIEPFFFVRVVVRAPDSMACTDFDLHSGEFSVQRTTECRGSGGWIAEVSDVENVSQAIVKAVGVVDGAINLTKAGDNVFDRVFELLARKAILTDAIRKIFAYPHSEGEGELLSAVVDGCVRGDEAKPGCEPDDVSALVGKLTADIESLRNEYSQKGKK